MAVRMSDGEDSFEEWLEGRPQIIRAMAASHPPDKKYRLTTTGQIGFLHSYSEDGTVTLNFPEEWNPQQLDGGRRVFGLNPADLEVSDT